jgi:hypothetical protein
MLVLGTGASLTSLLALQRFLKEHLSIVLTMFRKRSVFVV